MAQKSTHSSDLSLTGDYQGFLVETWKSDKQRPAIYGNASSADWSGYLSKGL